jgi:uncharacterized protein DUF3606
MSMAQKLREAAAASEMRIDLFSELDVAYWCWLLDVDPHELRHAVQLVGPRAAAVIACLRPGAAPQGAEKRGVH